MKIFISKWLEDNNVPIINTDGDYMVSKQDLAKLLTAYKQCNIANVVGQSEQLVCDCCGEPVKVNKKGNWIICSECGYQKEAN